MPWKYISNRKKTRTKRKKHFADYIVYVSIFMITAYTASAVVLQFTGLMEISSTLTTCWYGFWTAELITLASIKNNKTKNDKKETREENERGI